MTDPIQNTNPQQQGQQGNTDDILGGEDIFTPMSEEKKEEETLSYDVMIKNKYQFDPLPETLEQVVPAVQSTVSPIPSPPIPVPPKPIQEISVPKVMPTETIPAVQKNIQEENAPVVEKIIQQIPSSEEPKIEVPPQENTQTDVQKKFSELLSTTKKIYELKDKTGITEETFDILGANNDKVFISYRFLLDETDDKILFITKIEQDKETEEETINELKITLNRETLSLEVVVNDILLFDEIEDFTEDQKKKLQVIDKLNKFTFLASEELRKLEKEIKEKEEAEKERRRLQEIFRNF